MNFTPDPQIDHIFAHWDKPHSPGMSVAVSRGHEIVYCRGYGLADLDRNIPNGPATVFHAASLSKQFTAMAIMLLVGNGKLSLDDEVHAFIPQLRRAIPKITIRQMLHHTSGIRDQWTLATMAGWRLSPDVITREDVVETFVARMKTLNFKPGSGFSYSNTNFTLAADIVKKVSGLSLAEFSDKHIFKPLGMTRTIIIETHGQIVRDRACGYQGTYPNFQVMMPNYDLTGPTNVQTTVEDLMRWEQNFDLKTVGGEAALAAMQTTVPAFPAPYGLGLYVENNSGTHIVEHDGRDAGYRSHLIRFPDQKLAVALLCNVALPDDQSTWTLVRKVAAVFLKKHVPLPSATTAAAHRASHASKRAKLSDYVGRFYSDEIGSTYIVGRNGPSSIALARWKYHPTDLTAAGADTFHISNFSVMLPAVKVTFQRDKHGKIKGFSLDDISGENRLKDFRFTKVQ
jgi:CubicO group peptidase (beta-lactamase class C family)